MKGYIFAFYSPIMPAQRQWLLQLPSILENLKALPVPVIDRAIFEKLFHLRRRRAIELLHQFGGFQAGRTFLIDRHHLISELEKLRLDPDFECEQQRKKRLSGVIDEALRHKAGATVVLPVGPDSWSRRMADLPAGICFESGRLIVQFEKAEELLGKLFELAKAAHNDFEAFCTAAEKSTPV
jgi:hypothetical protein